MINKELFGCNFTEEQWKVVMDKWMELEETSILLDQERGLLDTSAVREQLELRRSQVEPTCYDSEFVYWAKAYWHKIRAEEQLVKMASARKRSEEARRKKVFEDKEKTMSKEQKEKWLWDNNDQVFEEWRDQHE